MLGYSTHLTKTAEVILVIEEPVPQWGAERENAQWEHRQGRTKEDGPEDR